MEKHNINEINKRILKNDNYILNDNENIKSLNIKLNTILLVYFNGNHFVGVPIEIFQQYLVIWDTYNDSDISIIMCPFSFVSCVYENHISPSKYIKNNLLIYQKNDTKLNESGELLDILNGKIIDMEHSDDELKRYSVKIGNYRSIMSMYPDLKILSLKEDKLSKFINFYEYINNDKIMYNLSKPYNKIHHPKTLVYLIQYTSSDNKIKNTIIVSKSRNSFNLIQGKIDKYFENYEQQIIDKKSFIIPMLWFIHNTIDNHKIIEL
jgi:hypothetical protein